MSSLHITTSLHSAWHRRTRELAQHHRDLQRGQPIAPPPSSVPPPPEEFVDVVRALTGYASHGLGITNFSAILAATSSAIGVDPRLLYPVHYLGGNRCPSDGVQLRLATHSAGIPVVCTEAFPSIFDRLSDQLGVPAARPYPLLNQVVLTGFDNWMCMPRILPQADLNEDRLANIHPRELATPASMLMMDVFVSSLAYTGCVRVATDAELDAMFTNIVTPGRWMKSSRWSFHDWFHLMGLSSRLVEEAVRETARLSGTEAAFPQPGRPTNVASPNPPIIVDELGTTTRPGRRARATASNPSIPRPRRGMVSSSALQWAAAVSSESPLRDVPPDPQPATLPDPFAEPVSNLIRDDLSGRTYRMYRESELRPVNPSAIPSAPASADSESE